MKAVIEDVIIGKDGEESVFMVRQIDQGILSMSLGKKEILTMTTEQMRSICIEILDVFPIKKE